VTLSHVAVTKIEEPREDLDLRYVCIADSDVIRPLALPRTIA